MAKKKKVLIGGHTHREILVMFKFKGLGAVTDRQRASTRRVFGFLDVDRDGRHSKQEYIENGVHMNRQSRQGIFATSDSNRDGYASEAEYVPRTGSSPMRPRKYFTGWTPIVMAGEYFKEEKLAKEVSKALNINGDGKLVIPEYLRVWSGWTRT